MLDLPPRLTSHALGRWLDRHNLYLLHRIGGTSPGDTLTATAFMRAAYESSGRRFVVVSKYAELFRSNPLVHRHVDFARLGRLSKPLWKQLLRDASHPSIAQYGYSPPSHWGSAEIARDHARPISELRFCCEHLLERWRVTLDDDRHLPELHIDPSERDAIRAKFSLPVNYVTVKPVGTTGYTPNKEWDFARFQGVVDAFPQLHWIQPAAPADRPLRGNNVLLVPCSIREMAVIIGGGRFLLACEGLPNHLAAAFGTPSIVVGSGFSLPQLASYPNTIMLLRDPPTPCTPCWLTTPCPVPDRPCSSDITVDAVIGRIQQRLESV